MIALDTNVIVRFLVRDDEHQAHAAYRVFKEAGEAREPLFVPLLVLIETIWVLESAYRLSRAEILDAIEDMRAMPAVRFEADPAVQQFLADGRAASCGLSDILIACSARNAGCSEVLTFDKDAAKSGMFTLLK